MNESMNEHRTYLSQTQTQLRLLRLNSLTCCCCCWVMDVSEVHDFVGEDDRRCLDLNRPCDLLLHPSIV